MPIRFHCQDCDAKIKVPEGAEGRKVKCPRCGAVHRVPAAEAAVASGPLVAKRSTTRVDLESLASAIGESSSDSSPSVLNTELDHHVGTSPDPSLPERPALEQEEQQLNDLDLDKPNTDEQDLDDPDLEEEDLDDEDLDQEDLAHEDFNESLGDEPLPDDDPLAALASMADTSDPDQMTGLDEADPEEPIEELFEPAAEPAFPSPEAPAAFRSSSSDAIPLAQPKPETAAPPEPVAAPPPTPAIRPRPASPEPRAIPLSSKPAIHRPTAKPMPLDESINTATLPYQPPPASLPVLLSLGWALRVLAVLTAGGAVKLALVASKIAWPAADCLLVLLYGLTLSVMIWALGEIALAVRHLASGRTGGIPDA